MASRDGRLARARGRRARRLLEAREERRARDKRDKAEKKRRRRQVVPDDPVVVADAHPALKGRGYLETTRPGGHGAVRELCDLISVVRQETTRHA